MKLSALALCMLFAGCSAPDPPAYDRGSWGTWKANGEHGVNGCWWDTRGWLLHSLAMDRDPRTLTIRDEPGKVCLVLTMTFIDPYTGKAFTGAARLVHIDHRVALAEVQRSWEAPWSREKRGRFFNDPDNLVATLATTNLRKSDIDPGGEWHKGRTIGWWPPDWNRWCIYAAAYRATKAKWRLGYDAKECESLGVKEASCQRISSW